MKKKRFVRFFVGLLAVSMIVNTTATAAYARELNTMSLETAVKGNELYKGDLAVTLNLNYPVKNVQGEEEGIRVKLTRATSTSNPINLLGKQGLQKIELDGVSYNADISLLDEDNMPAQSNSNVAMARITFLQVPQGTYTVSLSGNGFKDYVSGPIVLKEYSMHLAVANDNRTFTIGDINKDGLVDGSDLKSMEQQIGDSSVKGMADLNKDGLKDITDMAYLFNNMWAAGNEGLEKTKLIAEAMIDFNQMDTSLAKYKVSAGMANDLFSEGGTAQPMVLQSDKTISPENPIIVEVPMVNDQEVELQYVNLMVPQSVNAIKSGEIIYTDANGDEFSQPFGNGNTLKTQEIGAKAGYSVKTTNIQSNVITIDLGKKVAIKKITIKVTGTEGPDSKLAEISKVEFLQNVVPSDQTEMNTVKKLTAKGKNESVELSWQKVSNVTNYKIRYGTTSGNYDKIMSVEDNKAVVGGLLNNTTYYFVVYAANGDWKGPNSVEVSAMPKSESAPGRIGGVKVNPLDSALEITWGNEENSETYNVYYKVEGSSSAYTKISKLTGTTYRLSGLKNGEHYLVSVSGSNTIGEGDKSPEMLGIPEKIIVAEPEGIPTYNKIANSNIEKITLTDQYHFNPDIYPNGFDPSTMLDGDYNTHWTSKRYWDNAGFIVTFDKAYEMDHMVWVTRLDEKKYMQTLDRYGIEVWGPNDDLKKPGKEIRPNGSKITKTELSDKGVEILTFNKSTVKQIKVYTKMYDGGPALPSATEIMFYEYYSLVDEISALFSNDLHTALNNNVTMETINMLLDRVNGTNGEFYVDKAVLKKELEVAVSILNGKPIQNIITVEQGRDASKDGNKGFSYTLNDLQPIGITAKPKDNVLVYVDTNGESQIPKLVVTQYFAEYSSWQTEIELKQGRNAISIPQLGNGATPRGGSIYVQYKGASRDVKINVIGGSDMPILSLPGFTFDRPSEADTKLAVKAYVNELSTYVAYLKKNKLDSQTSYQNATEIGTRGMLLSLPATTTLAALGSTEAEQINNLYNQLLAMEEDMMVHYKVAGLSETDPDPLHQLPTSRINVRYMQLTGKAFMYAAGAHVGIGFGSCQAMVSGKPTAIAGSGGLFGWGINHEIGHVMDMRGLVESETTNNIHSLFAQTYDGANNTGKSRLEDDYQSIYDKVAVTSPGKPNNVFTHLGMYWQLHLAYDDGGNDSFDFYSRMYRLQREGVVTAANQDMLLVRLASDTAGKDLSDFFTRWGFELDDETKAYISSSNRPKETKALYYLNDEARRYRLANKSQMDVTSGTVTANQQGDSKKVTVTIDHDGANSDAILGYEISRNGKPVAFTTKKVYTDNIPTINNVSLDYTVKVYDKLLNEVSLTPAAPIKISHDGTIDNSTWTYSKLGNNTILVDMKEPTDISGIKITSQSAVDLNNLSGAAVTVSMNADMSGAMALTTGPVVAEKNLVYFQKAGAKPDDTRIWTYTASYLTIQLENLDSLSEVELKNTVQLIAYPGDNIDIDQKAIGVLGEDFKYGTGETDVIKAGTVIITGSYRGDPVYNAIKLKGIYSQVDCAKEEVILSGEKLIGGEQLFFAEVPTDNQYTAISDGFWIYIPEQGKDYVLPDKLKAELYRVDDPNTNANERMVSDTGFITSPTKETLPTISFTGDNIKTAGGVTQ